MLNVRAMQFPMMNVQAFPFLIQAPCERGLSSCKTPAYSDSLSETHTPKEGQGGSDHETKRILLDVYHTALVGVLACERAKTTEQSAGPSPAGVVERAVQETVDGIKGPMDKARGVEGTLGQAAERTAEQTSQTGP